MKIRCCTPLVYRGTKGFDVTRFLASLCEDYGVPVSCTSDGGPNLTAKVVEDMMNDRVRGQDGQEAAEG